VQNSWAPLACLAIGIGLLSAVARADTFLMVGGGRVEGELLNPDELPRQKYVVAMASGGRITLATDQVRNVVKKSHARQQYDDRLLRLPDTADGHWEMAEWCRRHGLHALRNHHLAQLILHDPEHAEARRGLGFTRIEGQWVRAQKMLEDQGYVHYRGTWRPRQDIDLEKRRVQNDLERKKWTRQLKRWRGWIGGRRDEEARQQIRAVRDPLAAPGFADLVQKETNIDLKLEYIRILGKLQSPVAIQCLIKTALEDVSERVRDTCLMELKQRQSNGVVRALVAELKSKDNKRVNRAGIALGHLADRSSMLPLIDSLVTEHKHVVRGSGQGGVQPIFGGGAGGLSVGGGQPKTIKRKYKNYSVLSAVLAKSDGVNYQFDVQAWKDWYAAQRTPIQVNLRRDE